MLRLLLVFSVVLLCGSIGAFFLFVPPLVIAVALVAAVALLLTGYALLYCFGAPPERKH
ncbi:MAG: hypothetical protein LAP61_23790 [Acidobacteriia bacterium]|nr:hypothetical protein [Terriglobia bacterium]